MVDSYFFPLGTLTPAYLYDGFQYQQLQERLTCVKQETVVLLYNIRRIKSRKITMIKKIFEVIIGLGQLGGWIFSLAVFLFVIYFPFAYLMMLLMEKQAH